MRYFFLTFCLLNLISCVSFSKITVAPFPCQAQHFIIRPIDLNPRAPKEGICVRSKIQQNIKLYNK